MTIKAISLFAGVGGICLGFKNNGVEIVYANDVDKYACKTYRANFSHLLFEGDIKSIDANQFRMPIYCLAEALVRHFQ